MMRCWPQYLKCSLAYGTLFRDDNLIKLQKSAIKDRCQA